MGCRYLIPQYLDRIRETERTYGVLKKTKDAWEIEGEPQVIQLAKRLFPGCNGRGRKIARFFATKRILADLNWLMMRYPLRIRNKSEWEIAYQETVAHVKKRIEISKRPIKLATPAKFNGKLLEFQKEGLAFLMHNRRALLADSMGTGKTPTALAWAVQINKYPVLIVIPPHLVKQWERETQRFLGTVPVDRSNHNSTLNGKLTHHIITGLKPYTLPRAHIYMMHYLLLRGWKDIFQEMDFEAIVFDEIQELRHAKTQKYSVASLVAERCENVIGLSGTPIYNRGGEIWNVLNILEFHCLGDWESFTREWCYGYGSDTVEDPELLGKYLKEEGLLLRRTKEDVLSELPPKRRIVQEIDANEGLYKDLIGKAVEIANEIPEVKDVFLKGRMMRDAVNETRRITGIAKAYHVAQFVRLILDAGEPCLLFAHHHDVVDIYLEELADYFPGCITGRQTLKEKDESVRRFMEEETNLLIISLRAATGLNLPRARAVVFGELDWSPAVHSQSEDRSHRIGTKDSVLCYYLVCSHGTDADMLEALGFKISQFTGIMGDKEESEADKLLGKKDTTQFMMNVLEKLQGTKIKKKQSELSSGTQKENDPQQQSNEKPDY